MASNHKHDFWIKAGLFVSNNIAALSSRPRMALNPKNGFVPKAFSCVFNNMVALNLIFNIFFFSAALAAPAKSGIVTEPLSLSC